MPARPRPSVLLGVGLVAGTTLALQVLLTRLFAAVLFYHFGFLAISLALLGVGAAGIVVYVRPQWFDRIELGRVMARWSLALAALTVAGLFVLVRLDYLYTGVTAGFVANLAVACVLSALPMFAGGVVIALAIRGYAREVGRVYAADLAGAAAGAALVVPLLWLVDAPTLAVGLSVVAALAALLFSGPAPERTWALAGTATAVVLVALSAGTSLFYLSIGGPRPDAERWTPLSRVSAFIPGGEQAKRGVVIYDRVVGEVLRYERGAPYPDFRTTQEGPESVGYAMTPASSRALIIGGGGGRDIMTALGAGYRHVDVIELNRGIRDMVDDDIGSFSGAPYTLPGVSTAIGDGRSTLARRDTKYDQIQIGFTDTFSANSAQAFALTENNLYTLEAFRDYIHHLTPDGVLKVSRPRKHSGEEALRATVLALEALRAEGVQDPASHVVVLTGTYQAPFKRFFYGSVLVRKDPWTPAQLTRIRQLARERGVGIASMPGGPHLAEWGELARASSPRAFCEHYPLNVCPPTDDQPFFFHQKRLGNLFGANSAKTIGVPDPMVVLITTLGILAVLSLLAFAAPLALVPGRTRPPVSDLAYFAGIGAGYLILEIVLVQRFTLFLGFPTYALSVVLFGLLLFTGLGSLLTTRPGRGDRRTLIRALVAACVVIAAFAVALRPLLEALIQWPFAARLAVTVAILAPVGLLLGTAMPIGLARLARLHPGGIPWAWGANGVTSVVASVLAVAIAVSFGYPAATLVALACYLGVLAHALLGRWPAAEEPVAAAPEPRADPLGAGARS